MNPTWRTFLSTAGAVFPDESPLISHFGDAAGELLAARDDTVLVPLSHLGVIQAEGDDTKSFLHSQLTSDVNHLADQSAQLSAWCSAKGRMQASFLVWRQADRYQLMLAADLQEPIQKRLAMFVLRAKVKLQSRTDDLALLGLSGSRSEAALEAAGLPCPGEPLQVISVGETSVLRLDTQRFLIATPADDAQRLWPQLTGLARPAGTPCWQWLDIQAAFPLISLATKEEFVPQMADFEKMGGVSFHKGCYPGQEIVARTQYLGKVKRHLYRVSAPVPLTAGQELFSPDNPDQSIGKIMTGAPSPAGGFVGLAVVQANFAGNVRLGSLDGAVVQAVAVNP